MVDQVANFKKVTVSTGYNNTATSIVLATGQGAELPDPSGDNYNVVWWDSTNYNDPADDPNVEIVRVTAKSSDTLTVTRNQESSGASNKNNADATYKMILATTAKTITDAIAISNATGMEDQSFTNLLENGDFESWSAGASSAPDRWVYTGDGVARSTQQKIGTYSCELTRSGSTTYAYQALDLHEQYRGSIMTMAGWIKTSTANCARILLTDGVNNEYSSYHTGGGDYEYFNVSLTIDAANDRIRTFCKLETNGVVQFDGIVIVEGSICPAFSPKPISANDLTIHMQTPQTLTGAGAVDIVTAITHIVTTGADALTLVDGTEGQEKFIVMKTDADVGTLTPSNLGNGTTITFDDVGDSAHLLFTNGAWHFMGGTATLA